ncbi:MAG: peroxidase-related enzyme [Saprospiraceae bacterium]|jgi:uncharacterized peroxidase-related enzyme|nr:peroxidase-related enzyme [Saprospiraceae bacterium]
MTWIKTISYDNAKGSLKKLYDRVKGPNDNVDNIMLAHSLRPHSMKGHMALYKNVLHHKNNQLPKATLEILGVYVSILNKCEYCVLHHFEGLKRLVNNEHRSKEIWDSLQNNELKECFEEKELRLLLYTRKLTLTPSNMVENDLHILREKGFSDGEILEVNQVVAYFNYANRTVLGLGINTEGDILGLSPNDDSSENNWGHQ